MNELSGRLCVEFEDLDPGLRHAVWLELRNHASRPYAVTNLPEIRARLADAAGDTITSSGAAVSGPAPTRHWMVVPPDAYLGFRIDLRTVGVPTREQGTALLALGTSVWRLGDGTYTLQATVAFSRAEDGPDDQWVGELHLPPVTVDVTPDRVASR